MNRPREHQGREGEITKQKFAGDIVVEKYGLCCDGRCGQAHKFAQQNTFAPRVMANKTDRTLQAHNSVLSSKGRMQEHHDDTSRDCE